VTTARPDEDAMLARATQWSLALALLALPAAAAQDLPDELNLQCEGTMSAVLEAASPITRNQTFRINLRLKDGTMVDTATGLVEGQGSGDLKMTLVDAGTQVQGDEQVFTQGYIVNGQPGLYPPGLLIGSVSRSVPAANDLQAFITIRPAVDFSNLDFVLVLKTAAGGKP
jgi:hypothetical protein